MTFQVGRGVRVEVQKTVGSAKTVTAVTLASPGVATSTSHGLANKSIGYFLGVTGMVQLEGQAVRVAGSATNTFNLEDIDTTDYSAFTAGNFYPVTAWSSVGNASGINVGGGEGDTQDITVLADVVKKLQYGLLAAQTVTVNLKTETISSEAIGIVRAAARSLDDLVFRVTFADGNVLVFRGTPSQPGTQLDTGGIGTGSFGVTVRGFVTEGLA